MQQLDGAMSVLQRRRSRSLSNSAMIIDDTDEDLVLFHEMQKREQECMSSAQFSGLGSQAQNHTSPGLEISMTSNQPMQQKLGSSFGISRGDDDIFSSDWDKNDYDWLLTPPATPFILTVDHEPSNNGLSMDIPPAARPSARLSKLGSSKSEPPSRSEPSTRTLRGNVGPQKSSLVASPGLSSSLSTASRRPMSANSNGASRSSTPSSNAAQRPSTPSSTASRPSTPGSNPIARPSTPSASSGAPRLSSSNVSSSTVRPSTPSASTVRPSTSASTIRPSTPTGRASIPSTTRSASSSRPTTPVRRPATPSRQSPNTLVRSSSVNKSGSMVTKSAASSRPSSPTTRAVHPAVVPGFSQEPPPNLRTSMPQRSTSNSRGSSVASRPGGHTTARTSQPELHDTRSRTRQQSTSPLVVRGRLLSGSQNGDRTIHTNGDSVHTSMSSAASSKMVDKTARTRKPILSSPEEHGSMAMSQIKRPVKSMSVRDTKSTPFRDVKSTPSRDAKSTVRESSGFGRNLSKKSLDMALRHMDIGRSTPGGFQSFMSNVSASSLYSVKSANVRGASIRCITDSPMATSSNASSEHGMSIVLDPEGSEVGDEAASEKGSKSSRGSQPDALFSLSNDKRVTSWLGSPDSRDDNGDVMHIFDQGMDMLSGTESPLISHHKDTAECDTFSLESMQ